MSTELIINASLPETRIALMENGEIQDLLIERASGKGITGNIYKGRVTRVLPGMQAAFVDIGLEKAAFLYVDDVFVHSEIWEQEEEDGAKRPRSPLADVGTGTEAAGSGEVQAASGEQAEGQGGESAGQAEGGAAPAEEASSSSGSEGEAEGEQPAVESASSSSESEEDEWAKELSNEDQEDDQEDDQDEDHDDLDEDDEDEEDDHGSEEMGPPPGGEGDDEGAVPAPQAPDAPQAPSSTGSEGGAGSSEGGAAGASGGDPSEGGEGGPGGSRRRHRRGRRGGRFRRRDREGRGEPRSENKKEPRSNENVPENFRDQVAEAGDVDSDRTSVAANAAGGTSAGADEVNRPQSQEIRASHGEGHRSGPVDRQSFRQQRSRDRRISPKSGGMRAGARGHVNIQDLLKEGQEVLVQVAKDPIATKGARLTCHISLPGRHLVCMPTIDHVGVSRRIERDDERRRLREYVEQNRPRGLGFIVRTASGKQSEKRITQDIEYLSRLWEEIREKAAQVTAPALVYEDLNSVLRAIRDWVTEDIDKIIVDSRYHYNEILKFVAHFMPSLKQKVELYHGDIPVFDAYGISTELSRALERKVWLKSGGYLVIDQAEALVAIDVNTGRYVGKKNLEDTILKTNLEAVQEIAYQLRLRNCGGIIILDLIDMEREENKQRVYRALEDALKRDRARPSILKISELGLVEMTRKRTRDTIVRALCDSCNHCEGKGFVKSKTTVAYEVLRELERAGIDRDMTKILVQANPDVIDILAIDERETLDQLERRYRKQIYLQAVADFHQEQFEVAGDAKPGKDAGKEFNEQRAHARRERGRDRDRGRGRDRDRGRGRDRDRGRNQDREDRGDKGAQGERSAGSKSVIRPVIQPVGQPAGQPVGQPAGQMEGAEGESQPQPDRQYRTADSMAGEAGNGDQLLNNGMSLTGPTGAPRADDGFDNEEDRLAFLRAQAAQDAALAKLHGDKSAAGPRGSHGPSHTGGPRGGVGQDRDRGGGGGSRRGRRGGRRGGSGGGGKFRGSGGSGGGGGGYRRDAERAPRETAISVRSREPGEGGGGGSGGTGGSGGESGGSSGGSDPSGGGQKL